MTRRLPLQCWIRKLGWVLTTLVVVLILYFSFIPAESAPRVSWIPFADKGAHLIAYAAFGFSSFLATLEIPGFSTRKRRRGLPSAALHISSWSGRSIIISLVTGTVLGALVEILQPLFGRSREWADLLADFMGLVVGLAVVLVLLKVLGSYFVTRPWLYDPNWEEEHESH
ncbi:MAG: antibiotic resistance protein VanZ [Sphaerochaeta sp.]|jgi:VanZ family protein